MDSRAAVVIRGPDPETQWVSLRDELIRRRFRTYRKYVERGQLMRDVRRGEIAAVVVRTLSDFAQSTRDLLSGLEELKKYNVRFVSVNESIDSATAMGDILTILRAIVDFERTIHHERICAGLDRARLAGKRLGRPPVHLDLETVQRLRSRGLSLRKIAEQLGCSAGVVQRMLKANFSPRPESAGHPRPAPDASQTAPALSRSPSRPEQPWTNCDRDSLAYLNR